MKDLVLLPLRFVAVLIVFLLVFTGVQVLIAYSQLPSDISSATSYSVLPLALTTVAFNFVPCIILTWIVLAFHVLHVRRLRFLMLLILGLFSAAAIFLSVASQDPIARLAGKQKNQTGFQVPENRILADENGFVLINKDNADGVKTIVYHGHGNDDKFVFIDEGKKDNATRTIVFPQEGLSMKTDAILGGRDSMFRAPIFFADFAAFVSDAVRAIYQAANKGLLIQLVFALGVATYLSGLWLLVRASRWPMFNVFLTLLGIAGLLALARLSIDPQVASALSVLPATFLPFVFPAVVAIIGLLLIGINLFLPPVKDWQREVAS